MFSFIMLLKECSVISLVKGAGKYSCQTDRQELKIISDSTWIQQFEPQNFWLQSVIVETFCPPEAGPSGKMLH